MSDTTPANNLSWRVTVLEREVDRLKEGKPDVVAERVTRLSSDIDHLRKDMTREVEELRDEMRERDDKQAEELSTQRRILIGAWVSIATGLIIAYALGQGGIS